MSTNTKDRASGLLKAELDAVAARLHAEAEMPKAGLVSGDFLDVAQSVEQQELALMSASRLALRARRLQIALSRVSDGEYGVCSECGAVIPPKRLLAVPDATTCVSCQERLEQIGLAS
jgi:phage/conjugal plasmid C-4 type zinc finger TraR family protein